MSSKILIVDDNAEFRDLLGLYLGRMDYDVIYAASGHEAINKSLTEFPKLVILDLGLPDINGFEVLKQLKANLKTSRVPVIVHAAWSLESIIMEAEAAGAAGYFAKPTPLPLLVETIKTLLKESAA